MSQRGGAMPQERLDRQGHDQRWARLAGDLAPWFVVLGYNFFILIAGTGYLLGITQSKEYSEPEWYADPWLTIVWVISPGLLGTIMRRKELHIYVANWFYLAFIVTIAVLAVCAWRWNGADPYPAKPSAQRDTVVHALGARGLSLIVLSGDRPQAVGQVAHSVAGFLWTLKCGQYDDLDGAALRILPDDDVAGTQ
jgi:cbb3-type cytochrome oxidase maturation protein